MQHSYLSQDQIAKTLKAGAITKKEADELVEVMKYCNHHKGAEAPIVSTSSFGGRNSGIIVS